MATKQSQASAYKKPSIQEDKSKNKVYMERYNESNKQLDIIPVTVRIPRVNRAELLLIAETLRTEHLQKLESWGLTKEDLKITAKLDKAKTTTRKKRAK